MIVLWKTEEKLLSFEANNILLYSTNFRFRKRFEFLSRDYAVKTYLKNYTYIVNIFTYSK
jgi:hypothetical protein